MAKLFTITEGLENLGALKTGGQGSVYKGKRMGEILTAIKLLPTPILSEDANDKNYSSFINEVEKLKKVNEEPNPNVVTILGSGITETGCLPFIEMEFIEGPDLGELLKPPCDPVFTITEVIKVACHLSNALAHCHSCDVKHGDIKSNNVKFNKYTGNYILLDFGLAVMSDEDRRTSLRHAGAIEFMAPEQNDGKVLLQTDVYSFGVIIFELLAGIVPFPLHDSGETARNAVMLSHMETPPPDVLELRKENLPDNWSDEKKELEMLVPEWLTDMLYKCLAKKPEDRFADGIQLHDHIMLNSAVASKRRDIVAGDAESIQLEVEKLLKEKDELQKQLLEYQNELKEKEASISAIITGAPRQKTVARSAFYAVLIIAIVLFCALIPILLVKGFGNGGGSSTNVTTDSVATIQPNNLTNETSKTGKDENLNITKDQSKLTTKQLTPTDSSNTEPIATTKKPEKKPATDSTAKEDTATHHTPNELPDNY